MTHVLKAVKFRHVVKYDEQRRPLQVKVYRRGDVVDDLPPAQFDRLLRLGEIIELAEPDVEPAVDPVVPDVVVPDADVPAGDSVPAEVVAADVPVPEPAAPAPLARPKNTARKDAWVDYAVSKGWDREVAEETDKSDLIEQLP